jgi:hypothetical protein
MTTVVGVEESQEIVYPIVERGLRVLSNWSWLGHADLTEQDCVTKPTMFPEGEFWRMLYTSATIDSIATGDLIAVA